MNIQEMMRQAQKMKQRIEQAKADVEVQTFEGSAGGGMVVVVANGKNQVVSVKVEREVVNPEEIDMLQDLIVAATNQALSRAAETMQAEMGKITGGMLPGVF